LQNFFFFGLYLNNNNFIYNLTNNRATHEAITNIGSDVGIRSETINSILPIVGYAILSGCVIYAGYTLYNYLYPGVNPSSNVNGNIINTPSSNVNGNIINTPSSNVNGNIINTPSFDVNVNIINTPSFDVINGNIINTPSSNVNGNIINTPSLNVNGNIINTPSLNVNGNIINTLSFDVINGNIVPRFSHIFNPNFPRSHFINVISGSTLEFIRRQNIIVDSNERIIINSSNYGNSDSNTTLGDELIIIQFELL
jgi:hypothetical protein